MQLIRIKYVNLLAYLLFFGYLNFSQKAPSAFLVSSTLHGYFSINHVKNSAQSIFSLSIFILRSWNNVFRSSAFIANNL